MTTCELCDKPAAYVASATIDAGTVRMACCNEHVPERLSVKDCDGNVQLVPWRLNPLAHIER